MREHHALGAARGAARVHEGGQIVGRGARGQVGDVVARGKPLFHTAVGDVFERDARFGLAGEYHTAQGGHVAGTRERIPARHVDRDEKLGAAVVDDVVGVARRVGGVQGNGHQAVAKRGHVKRQGIDAVGKEHGHTRAALQAHFFEGLAPAHHALGKFPPGNADPFVGAVLEPAIGFAVGMKAHRALEHLGQGLELIDESGGQNKAPDRKVYGRLSVDLL